MKDWADIRFKDWLDEGTRMPTLLGAAVTIGAFVSFGFIDRLYKDANAAVLNQLLWIRGFIVAALILLLVLRATFVAKGWGAVFGSALLLCITVGASWVAAALGGAPIGYYAAVAIGMVCYGTGMPSSAVRTGALCAASIATYFLMLAFIADSGLTPAFAVLTQGAILSIAGVWATGTTFFRNAGKRREIGMVLRLEELDAAKNSFFANVNHELRTPLMLVLASVENMRDEPGQGATISQYADIAYRNGLRLLKMVDGLLALSKLESSGASQLRPTRFSLSHFLGEQADMVKPIAAKKQVALAFAGHGPQINVFADKEALEQVVQNLLTNALKFTKPGGRIDIDVKLAGDVATVTVTDTGAGIAEEDQPHVFRRFYQGSGARAVGRAGVGIGLSMCQRIVDLHGGHIGIVSSKLNRGTCIAFTVPKAGAGAVEQEMDVAAGSNETGVGNMPEWDKTLRAQDGYRLAALEDAGERRRVLRGVDQANGQTLLIVDDDRDMLEIIKGMVAADFNVHVASDGAEGLELARRLRPAVIISDVNMPGDGRI